MKIIRVELLNDKALKLLQQLEQLHILRLLGSKKEIGSKDESPLTRQWAGSLSKETAHKMLKSVDQSRSEWERNI